MQLFMNHIGYIGITLLAGMAIGWSTHSWFIRMRARLRGEGFSYQPVERRHRTHR
jgi:hypothetical protein